MDHSEWTDSLRKWMIVNGQIDELMIVNGQIDEWMIVNGQLN